MVVSLLNGCLAVDGATSLTAAESIYGLQTGGGGGQRSGRRGTSESRERSLGRKMRVKRVK